MVKGPIAAVKLLVRGPSAVTMMGRGKSAAARIGKITECYG